MEGEGGIGNGYGDGTVTGSGTNPRRIQWASPLERVPSTSTPAPAPRGAFASVSRLARRVSFSAFTGLGSSSRAGAGASTGTGTGLRRANTGSDSGSRAGAGTGAGISARTGVSDDGSEAGDLLRRVGGLNLSREQLEGLGRAYLGKREKWNNDKERPGGSK